MADVDDYGIGARIARIRISGEKARHFCNRLLRRGKSDADRWTTSEMFQSLQ